MKKRMIGSILVLLLSFVLICLGLRRGELMEVVHKSIHICMECIGIG